MQLFIKILLVLFVIIVSKKGFFFSCLFCFSLLSFLFLSFFFSSFLSFFFFSPYFFKTNKNIDGRCFRVGVAQNYIFVARFVSILLGFCFIDLSALFGFLSLSFSLSLSLFFSLSYISLLSGSLPSQLKHKFPSVFFFAL